MCRHDGGKRIKMQKQKQKQKQPETRSPGHRDEQHVTENEPYQTSDGSILVRDLERYLASHWLWLPPRIGADIAIGLAISAPIDVIQKKTEPSICD